ncbi:ComEC/Rec2 family competence protein [Candidatus Peregrinibacteria bacterium]|nr:ComEC/Rec2 family competence protein [Candidatus Peregrinibacteria bacterium]
MSKMNRDGLINSFLIAFLAGVSLGALLWKNNLLSCLGVGVVFLGLLYLRKRATVLMIVFLGCLLGLLRLGFDIESLREYRNYDGEVVAELKSFPEIRSGQQLAVLEIRSIGEKVFLGDFPKLMATFNFFDRIIPGQRFILEGKLTALGLVNLRERDDWFRKKLNFQMEQPNFQIIYEDKFNLLGWLFIGRTFLLAKINQLFDQQTATMVAGVILGERGNIDKAILNDFKTTGLTHILAVSGFNITIIINFILLGLIRFGKWWRLVLVIMVIVLFVILTGASASVIRAGVMGVLALLIRTSARSASILKVLLISGALIVFFDPTVLNFDLSFQLSFGATLSLVLFADWIDDFDFRAGWWKELVMMVIWQTIAAQLIVLPIIFVNFGQVSLISPIANLLTAPLIPVLMFLGILTILIGQVWLFLGQIVGVSAQLLVIILLKVTNLLAKIPLASWTIGEGQYWLAIVYWYILFKLFRKRKLGPSFG